LSWIDATRKKEWALLKVYSLLSVTWLIQEIATMYLIVTGFNKGTVTIGDTALVITLSGGLVMNLWGLTKSITKTIKSVGEISQGIHTIMVPHAMLDIPNAPALTVPKGAIQFNQVNFAYTQGQPLFTDLSFTIAPGQKVGLVGYSGSGKTTIVNLMLRLFDTQNGTITIDGQDIRRVTQESLHAAIAFIPQDPALFHRSLYENIHYGRFDATETEIFTAARQAHVAEFVDKLPQGYQSLVGDRGVKLSGGQRQRIAIARAFLKHAPILIMDEATSALDSATEKYIQDSLKELIAHRTTIVIAHRLATLLSMDRIIVLDAGKIIEDGSHAELLAKRGKYYELWQAQSNGFIADKSE
jgi:ABC-type transport system involved in Fe-S cluster assembly, permease and ATPase components